MIDYLTAGASDTISLEMMNFEKIDEWIRSIEPYRVAAAEHFVIAADFGTNLKAAQQGHQAKTQDTIEEVVGHPYLTPTAVPGHPKKSARVPTIQYETFLKEWSGPPKGSKAALRMEAAKAKKRHHAVVGKAKAETEDNRISSGTKRDSNGVLGKTEHNLPTVGCAASVVKASAIDQHTGATLVSTNFAARGEEKSSPIVKAPDFKEFAGEPPKTPSSRGLSLADGLSLSRALDDLIAKYLTPASKQNTNASKRTTGNENTTTSQSRASPGLSCAPATQTAMKTDNKKPSSPNMLKACKFGVHQDMISENEKPKQQKNLTPTQKYAPAPPAKYITQRRKWVPVSNPFSGLRIKPITMSQNEKKEYIYRRALDGLDDAPVDTGKVDKMMGLRLSRHATRNIAIQVTGR